MFKWTCLAVASVLFSVAAGLTLWTINSFTHDVRSKIEGLPQIVENSKKTTQIAAEFAEDAKDMRALLGMVPGARDKSVLRYAREVMDAIELNGKGGVIVTDTSSLKGRVFSKAASKLLGDEKPVPVENWLPRARKEALWLVLSEGTKSELLHGICRTRLGMPLAIKFGDAEPIPLETWIRQKHEASRNLEKVTDSNE